MAKKIAVFDFDLTLALTPLKPMGWVAKPYVAPDERVREGDDWWIHPESLECDYDFHPIVIKEFEKARLDPEVRAVMLTGRMGMRTAHIIRGKLRQHGYFGRRMISPKATKALNRHKTWPNSDHPKDFEPNTHEEYYKGDWAKEDDYPPNAGADTLVHKQYVINRLLDDECEELDFWDDRYPHYLPFVEFFQDLVNNRPNLKVVRFYRVCGIYDNNIILKRIEKNLNIGDGTPQEIAPAT